MKGKFVKLLALIVVSFIFLTGCSGEKTNNISDNSIKEPSEQIMPSVIQEWIENSRSIFLGQAQEYDGKLYILVTYGEKPSGGFAVEITEVRELHESIEVTVEFIKPGPGDIVTEAITYPYDIVAIEPTDKEIKFIATGAEMNVPLLLGIDQLEPIVAGERGVMVFEPAPNSRVIDGRFTFRGITNTFEGTANYRIKLDSEILQEGFVTGSMLDWGYFAKDIILPSDTSGLLTMEIFIIDAKDGEEIDQFNIPLDAITTGNTSSTGQSGKLSQAQEAFPAVQLLPIDESATDPEFKEFLASVLTAAKQKNVEALKEHLASEFYFSFGHDGSIAGFIEYWGLDKNPAASELWGKLTTTLEMGGTFAHYEEASYYFTPYVFSAFPENFSEYEFAAIIEENVPIFKEDDQSAAILEHLDYHLVRLLEYNINNNTWVKIETPSGNIGYVEGNNLRSPMDYKAGFVKEDNNWQMIYFIAGD